MNLTAVWTACIERQASDVHLSVGVPPILRVDGVLQRLSSQVLTPEDMQHALDTLMPAHQRERLAQAMDCDFAVDIAGVARCRVNVFWQTRGVSIACRVIADRIASLADLGAPPALAELAQRPHGLVLVTGPTGSGKSTTLAAIIDGLNHSQSKHVLTIEDPVEYVHVSRQCLIQQREVGSQTPSFAQALRAALREDPDVLLVGEMRDLDTIRLALTAAETGHLVLASLHTASAPKAVDRIVDAFPAAEKAMARSLLSESLTAVVSQVLCARKNTPGRVAAFEVMVATPAIRHLIRDDKVAQMYSAMQTGSAVGMQTLDQSLLALVQHARVDAAEAQRHARYPEHFQAMR